MESPFCGVDEFDVFMDDVTRTFALTALVHGALESGRQFFFLTPHDSRYVPSLLMIFLTECFCSIITPSDRTKVFRLDPPRP